MSKELSWGVVISRDHLGKLTLPQKMLDDFYAATPAPNNLVIFTPQKNNIKIEVWPVETNEVLKISLVMKQFSPAVFRAISRIIQDLAIPMLYTSGVCIQDDMCVYEGYIERAKIAERLSVAALREKFLAVPDLAEHLVSVTVSEL
jgi:hypothetical protein